jgi:hypothetical protein
MMAGNMREAAFSMNRRTSDASILEDYGDENEDSSDNGTKFVTKVASIEINN